MKHIALAPAVLAALLPLAAVAAAPALAQPAAAPPRAEPRIAPRPSEPGVSQLFHVTLVAASKSGGGTAAGNLPKGVAKALDDIKDFLPYQSYRVVDSALVRASREAHPRLKGPDGSLFQTDILFREADPDGAGARSFLVEHFELRRMPRLEDLERMAAGERRPGRAAAVAPLAPEPNLTASFRIARGETVVVGSSRLDGGDDALIVLLTAVP